METKKTKLEPNPLDKAGIFSKLTFAWLLPFFVKGFKQPIEKEDLFTLREQDSSVGLGDLIDKHWNDELSNAKNTKRKSSFVRALFKCFGPFYCLIGFLAAIEECLLRVVQPLFLDGIIRYYDGETNASQGWAHASMGLIVAVSVLRMFVYHPFNFYCRHLVLQIKAAIGSVVYRKVHKGIGQPLCLGYLIRYFNSEPGFSDLYVGVLFSFGIMFGSLLYVGTHHPFFWGIQITGMHCRISSCSLVYRKALRLSNTALGQTTIGQMVNLLSNDVNRFDTSVIFLHYLWIGPLQTLIVTIILWQYLGPSCLAGIVLLILFVPLQSYMGRVFSRLRLATAHRTDERIRIMNEIVNAMRVIKMYAWEKPFTAMIKEARRKEINIIMKTNYYRALNMSLFFTSNKIIIFLALLVYVLTGNTLTAEKVFVTTSLINNIRLTMTLFLPLAVAMGSETLISCQRIQKFLEMEEKEDSNRVQKSNLRPKSKDCSVKAHGVSARWIPTSMEDDLKDISFDVKAGKLLAVVGSVGAGKSSLLHTVLSELPIKQGSIQIRGKVAYVSQEPWLFAGTVKQNILFGQPFMPKKYHEVIRVCALERDLEILPDKDETMVGERGTALSGGQKARINLARAVYYEADIYLLDDPLSAVDTNVGKHLFDQCISEYLSNKVRILVTHQLQLLRTADEILVLHNGATQAQGTYDQLTELGIDFNSLIGEKKAPEPEEEPDILHITKLPKAFQIEAVKDDISPFTKLARLRRDSLAFHHSLYGSNSSLQESTVEGNSVLELTVVGMVGGRGSTATMHDELPEELPSKVRKDEGMETKKTGSVGFSIYANYFKAGGGAFFISTLVVMSILTQVLFTGSDYWLAYWTNHERSLSGITSNSTNDFNTSTAEYITATADYTNSTADSSESLAFDRETYVYVYTGMTVTLFILAMTRTVMFFFLCMVASKTLHLKMFTSIINAPIKFFDTHPIGQVLNRFTKDLGQLDDLLPPTLYDFLSIMLTFIGIIVIISVVNVWILLPTIGLAAIFFLLRMLYIASARDIKRLEGITRSPVFSHLSTSLQGLTTIRALEAQDTFIKDFDDHQDLHSSAWFLFLCTTRCFGIWLDLLACLYIIIVTFSFLGRQGEVMGGDVGLAISSAMMLSGMFQWGVRQSAEVENQMTSVERVLEYSKVKPESPQDSKKENKKPGWPNCGTVSFQDVSLRYDPDDPPVLKNINFTIEGGHKVGVVGRTGAGKSSLLTCLFRLTQPGGKIFIDGVDTDSIHLGDLRESISIIPQDPTLFNGTMRENLDPFSSHTDDEIWNALDEVQLKGSVSDMTGGLSAFVSEGGGNLSVGQRQLVCLARAILRHNKILVMDEATANVDPQTDHSIQQTIRRKFVDCTVLTIAHRLHTIMDSDKVIVMEAGEVEEYGSPHELLQDETSIFSELLSQTEPATEEHLRQVARQAYYGRINREKDRLHSNLLSTSENNNLAGYDVRDKNNRNISKDAMLENNNTEAIVSENNEKNMMASQYVNGAFLDNDNIDASVVEVIPKDQSAQDCDNENSSDFAYIDHEETCSETHNSCSDETTRL